MMRLSLQIPYAPAGFELAQQIGVDTIQLRVGPGFALDMSDRRLEDCRRAADDIAARGFKVAALGYYRNILSSHWPERDDDIIRLQNVMRAAPFFGTDLIGVFAGRVPELSLEDNLPHFAAVWGPLAVQAEDQGIRFAFENCPMYRGVHLRGINMACTPYMLREMFELVPSPALGIEFDPSHLIKLWIDPVDVLKDCEGRIYHVHAKDHELLEDEVRLHGRFDLRTSRDRYPGLGQVDFDGLFAELKRQGYDGAITIEGERDPDHRTPHEITQGLRTAAKHLRGLLA